MTVDAAVLLTQTCDIYRKATTTTSGLKAKVRNYPASATVTAEPCFLGRVGRGNVRDGQARAQSGTFPSEMQALIVADDANIQEEDQIVMQTLRNGSAMTSAQKERHTYYVQQILDGTATLGIQQCLVSTKQKRGD